MAHNSKNDTLVSFPAAGVGESSPKRPIVIKTRLLTIVGTTLLYHSTFALAHLCPSLSYSGIARGMPVGHDHARFVRYSIT